VAGFGRRHRPISPKISPARTLISKTGHSRAAAVALCSHLTLTTQRGAAGSGVRISHRRACPVLALPAGCRSPSFETNTGHPDRAGNRWSRSEEAWHQPPPPGLPAVGWIGIQEDPARCTQGTRRIPWGMKPAQVHRGGIEQGSRMRPLATTHQARQAARFHTGQGPSGCLKLSGSRFHLPASAAWALRTSSLRPAPGEARWRCHQGAAAGRAMRA